MKNVDILLTEYAESHQNKTNKKILRLVVRYIGSIDPLY